MMTYLKRTGYFTIVTTVLVAVIFLLVGMTVIAQKEQKGCDRAVTGRAQGEEYVMALREYLEELGYTNSGVTLSRVFEDDVETYRVTVHHRAFEKLDEEQKNALLERLADFREALEVSEVNFYLS